MNSAPDLEIRASAQLSVTPRPFLRWAGSKRRLLPAIVQHLPTRYGRYWEPFLGSGALYFLLQPPSASLNDSCAPLVSTYAAVRDGASSVAARAASWPVNRDEYYAVRRLSCANRFENAAKFIYLNKTCWNGLYRVNAAGSFNVPFGKPKSANVIDDNNLVECGRLMRNSDLSLTCGDFEAAIDGAMPGDLVFLDPPYVTRHNNNGFIDYNERLFNWTDQTRLARVAETLRARGVSVIVSNAFHSDVIDLYPNFDLKPLSRQSTLAGDKTKRTTTTEALFVGVAKDG